SGRSSRLATMDGNRRRGPGVDHHRPARLPGESQCFLRRRLAGKVEDGFTVCRVVRHFHSTGIVEMVGGGGGTVLDDSRWSGLGDAWRHGSKRPPIPLARRGHYEKRNGALDKW